MQDFERTARGAPRFLAALGLAIGGLSYWGWALLPQGRSEPMDVSVWITDRGAGTLVGLDRDLLVQRRVSLPSPVEVEAGQGGGAWVVTTPTGGPLGPHTLVAVDAAGRAIVECPLRTARDLVADARGRAFLIDVEEPGDERILVAEWGETVRELARVPGASSLAAGAGRLLIGTTSGDLVLLREPGESEVDPSATRRHVGGALADVAPRATDESTVSARVAPAGWWVLDGATPGRLLGLDAELRPQIEIELGFQALHIAPDPRGGVWIAAANEPLVRRYGPSGELELERRELPLGGLDRGAAWGNGGVLLVAPGALLQLDAMGQSLPGQGGFDFLVDVAPLPGAGEQS